MLLVFPSFVKNLLVFLVFQKFGTFLDECFDILFHNKIFMVLNLQSLVFFMWSDVCSQVITEGWTILYDDFN